MNDANTLNPFTTITLGEVVDITSPQRNGGILTVGASELEGNLCDPSTQTTYSDFGGVPAELSI